MFERSLEITSMRVKLVRVEGVTPSAQLVSNSEAGEFSVLLSEGMDQMLGHLVSQEIDADLCLERDPEGHIIGGRLLHAQPLDDVDAIEAWRDFYRQAVQGDGITSIDEMMRDLGRDE